MGEQIGQDCLSKVVMVSAAEPASALLQLIVDATARDRPARQAQVRAEALEFAELRNDQLLAIVSHELRDPLAAIHYAAAALTTNTCADLERMRMYAFIKRQSLRMSQLVDDLLDLARVDGGTMTLNLERVDLRVVLNHSIETVAPHTSERGHRINVALPAGPVWLKADEFRLEQVFVNLLSNASKYTDAGGDIRLTVHADGVHALVRVSDTGVGIPADGLVDIFRPFRQINPSDPRSQSGLGIGLALVRNLVELHGGSVSAASRGIGTGSQFSVILPGVA